MLIRFFEQRIAAIWNRLIGRRREARFQGGSLDLGFRVVDDETTKRHVTLTNQDRMRHVVVLGKTGSGKSYLLRHMSQQDVEKDRGFIYFDLHGDATPFLMQAINARERRERRHLSDKLVLIDPSDPIMSVGLNPLEQETPDFVRIAEVAEILKRHWALDHFGARTDELLRNTLYALSANNLTLVELVPFLTNKPFRAAGLTRVPNADIRQYFELRYDQASEAMQATMREPILNKTSAFTADPKFRHIVGQPQSTFSFREAMDEGYWIIVNLAKGRLGAQALTLGSLIFTMVKNALFARTTDRLCSLYCDEIQNFVAQGSEIETVLAEARKTRTGFVSANQFLDQLPAEMRAALFSAGTHIFFQLSSGDATQISQALDGGKPLAERLKNLYQRHAIVKTGANRWTEFRVPDVHALRVDYTDLLNRVRYTRGRVRAHVERDIAKRVAQILETREEQPDGWE
jgi:energy-coupling factor transporter ATP-binding protein EcfA2